MILNENNEIIPNSRCKFLVGFSHCLFATFSGSSAIVQIDVSYNIILVQIDLVPLSVDSQDMYQPS